jgi:hypothetical protein
MDRKNEKTIVAIADEELSTVAGGDALGATAGPFSPNIVVDASPHINTATFVQLALPTLVNFGGAATQGSLMQAGAATQF